MLRYWQIKKLHFFETLQISLSSLKFRFQKLGLILAKDCRNTIFFQKLYIAKNIKSPDAENTRLKFHLFSLQFNVSERFWRLCLSSNSDARGGSIFLKC